MEFAINQRYGCLQIIREPKIENYVTGKRRILKVLCQCDCGVTLRVSFKRLITNPNSCSAVCMLDPENMIVKEKNYLMQIGEKKNFLTLIDKPFYRLDVKKRKLQIGKFECDCGNKVEGLIQNVANEDTKSCGCQMTNLRRKLIQQGTFLKDGIKKCSVCKEFKLEEDFHKCAQAFDGISPSCKKCKMKSRLKWSYNLTIEEYDEMLKKQNGKCAICLSSDIRNIGQTRFSVDHCHKTGKVRGLLCSRCNKMLGQANDDITILNNAQIYLEKFKA